MITINLLPQELRRKEAPKIVMPEIPIKKTLIIAAIVFFGCQALFTLAAGFVALRTTATTAAMRSLLEKNQDLQQIKSKSEKMQAQIKELKAVTSRNFSWAALLSALSNSVTKGVWLRSLLVEEQEVAAPPPQTPAKPGPAKAPPPPARVRVLKLEGSVIASGQETAYIGKFLQSLKQNEMLAGLFDSIELSSMNQRRVKEFDVFDFMILCKFKKDKAP